MLRHGTSPEPYLAAVAIGQMRTRSAATVAPALIAALHSPDGDVAAQPRRDRWANLAKPPPSRHRKAMSPDDPDPEAAEAGNRGRLENWARRGLAPLPAALERQQHCRPPRGCPCAGSLGGAARAALPLGGGGQRPGRRSPFHCRQGAPTDSRGVSRPENEASRFVDSPGRYGRRLCACRSRRRGVTFPRRRPRQCPRGPFDGIAAGHNVHCKLPARRASTR